MRKTIAQLERQVSVWNAAHPIGTKVIVYQDDRSQFQTVTRSGAWVMGEHSAVVMVDGISGGYSLDRVHAY